MGVGYQPQTPLPARIVRGVATPSDLPVFVDSVLTAPTEGTYTLTRPDGTKAVDAQSVTITEAVATYSTTLSSSETVGDGWQETWSLTFAGPVTKLFYRDAACVLRAYPAVIGTADLLQRHPELDGQFPPGDSNADRYIREAHTHVGLWLLQQSRDPWLVVSPYSFRDPQLLWALCFWFRALSTYAAEGSRYAYFAEKYEVEAKAALTSMKLTYDENRDNHPDVSEQGQSGASILFLSQPPQGSTWWKPWGNR